MYTGLRWDALLLGCLLAIVPVRLRGRPALVVGVTSVACLAVICVREPDPIPVHFFTVATVACGAVLVLAFDQKWLANPVLRHFGMISYGLYLWHGVFLRYGLWPPLALALSIGAAEISYFVVERPFLRPGMSRIVRGRPGAPADVGEGLTLDRRTWRRPSPGSEPLDGEGPDDGDALVVGRGQVDLQHDGPLVEAVGVVEHLAHRPAVGPLGHLEQRRARASGPMPTVACSSK